MRRVLSAAILILLAATAFSTSIETPPDFVVEVHRSFTNGQSIEDVRILALLEARFKVFDKIGDYLKSETEIGRIGITAEVEEDLAFIAANSRDTTETWAPNQLTLAYRATINQDIIGYLVSRLAEPLQQTGQSWVLTGFKQVYEKFKAEYREPVQCEDILIDLRGDFHTYDWMEKAKFSAYNDEGRIEALTAAIKIRPQWGHLYLGRADAYKDAEKYDLAFKDCEKSIELEPDSASSYATRGSIHERLSLFEKALADYQKAIELDPDDPNNYQSCGRIYKKNNDVEKALEYYKKAVELNPYDFYSYSALGHIFKAQTIFDQALECFNKCVELRPDDPDGYANRAHIYSQNKNDFTTAIIEYTKAIERQDDQRHLGLLYTCRGIAYMFNDELEKAKSDFVAADELGEEKARQFLRQFPKTD